MTLFITKNYFSLAASNKLCNVVISTNFTLKKGKFNIQNFDEKKIHENEMEEKFAEKEP